MFGFLFALLALVCPGDANGDHVVNVLDMSAVSGHYGQVVEPWSPGDANGDGVVNILDLVLASHNYGRICVTAPGLASD